MKDFSEHPFRHIFRGAHGDVVWVVARSTVARSISDIARISGRSKSQVKLIMERLHELRIVDRTMMDGWSWNSLNDAHPYAPMLREMARMDFETNEIEISKSAYAPNFWTYD
jgi:DNA-binding transcriptional regulator GbsR (MarR family)